jgi:transposase InsO family protein
MTHSAATSDRRHRQDDEHYGPRTGCNRTSVAGGERPQDALRPVAESGRPTTDLTGWMGRAVLDVYWRRVVGWSIDSSPTAALVTNALGMAIQTRAPPAGAIIHSDQGGSSPPGRSPQRAKDSGLVPSMGSVGTAMTI